MTNPRRLWYTTAGLGRVAQLLGIFELAGGLALLLVKHDEAQGYALLAIGAATFGSLPWFSRARSR